MSKRLIKEISSNLSVYHDTEWGEYVVEVKNNPDANYHTDDLDDAMGTAKLMHKKEIDDWTTDQIENNH